MPSRSDSGLYSSLRSVTRGASVFAIGTGLSKALGFVFQVLLTRGLGAELYGIYTYGFTLAMFVVNFADLGTSKAILKFIPQYEDDLLQQNRLLGLAYLTSFGGSLLLGGSLYVFAPTITELTLNDPLLADVLRIFAVFIVFYTLTRTVSSVFQSVERQAYKMLLENVTTQTLRILSAGTALVVGASVVGVTAAIIVGTVLTFGIAAAVFLSRTSFRPTLGGSRGDVREFYDVSLPLTFLDAGRLLYRRIDVLMVGFLLSASSGVGVYNIATVLASLLRLPLTGFNQLFPPIASRLYSNGEIEELQSMYTMVTRWTFTISLLPAAATLVYAEELLGIFGTAFTTGVTVLLLFVLGELMNALAGPSNYMLIMTDHQYVSMVNEWVLGVLNVVLNYLFISWFGLVGAALATVSVLSVINFVRVVEVWYLEGLVPYSLKFFKPIFAGVGAGAVMFGLKTFLSGYLLLVIGGAVGALVFALGLFALGIEQEDKEFFVESVPALESVLS
ncbi:flippase [Halocatena salina]|uniref:Flippase n=1 Tax=Halocatena salina TaxID=2934340 RepID=A0A8T9ZYU4_9EURY|nr:flippase [Halocatena salina]UPM41902.1 flippase [Halocatena salina]